MSISLSQFAGVGAQLFDNNGIPLSGGKIYSYAAGTTTPLATYTQVSGSVFHTNPIILDAAGRVPSGGEIWLNVGQGYKFVVYTANNELIATYDNIPSAAQPLATNDADTIFYEQGYTVTAGNFVVGKTYRITSLGTTDFTLIGATSNTLLLHFVATGVGAGTGTAELSQTVEAKLRQTVSVKDFGAVGDGVTNDTAAIQAALNSGYNVMLPSGTYSFTSELVMQTNNQSLFGQGVLKPVGAINGVKVTGGCTGVELNLTFNSASHSGGYCVYISNGNRVKIAKLNIVVGWGALYVERANVVVVDFLWATCSGPGVVWYGNDTTRSDVLTILFGLLAVPSTQYGLNWDGNCHSLEIKYFGIVGGKGAIIQNTSGVTTFPAIGRFDHIEVDYSNTHGIEIKAGLDYDFVAAYVLGATGDGLKVAATINDYEVRVTGGKFIGNTGYGINNLGGILLYAGNSALYSNTLGTTNGNIRMIAPSYFVDTEFGWKLQAGNPVIAFDLNDYQAYERATNTLRTYLNGLEVWRIEPNYSTFVKPNVVANYTVATLPAGVLGMQAIVTDATTAIFANPAVGGGGITVPVYYDGGTWRIG